PWHPRNNRKRKLKMMKRQPAVAPANESCTSPSGTPNRNSINRTSSRTIHAALLQLQLQSSLRSCFANHLETLRHSSCRSNASDVVHVAQRHASSRCQNFIGSLQHRMYRHTEQEWFQRI